MQNSNSRINRKLVQGAALLLAAGILPVQAQPASAAELFVGAVLVSSAPAPGAPAPDHWDGRDDAGQSFIRSVLLPRVAAATVGSDAAPRAEAASLFVDTVLKPQP